MINQPYGKLAKRLEDSRGWATGVTNGNRCALVVGAALNVRPDKEEKSYRALTTGVKDGIRGMPLLARYFFKAQDLADAMVLRFGKPDITKPGQAGLEAILRKKGVVFLQDCWIPGIAGKFLGGKPTGDHIDLWDGNTLEIYRKDPQAKVWAFVARSRNVWFWETPGG